MEGEFHGYRRSDFQVAGVPAVLIAPRKPDPARRWVWCMEFLGSFPTFDLAMLERGWWIAHLQVGNTFGCPDALRRFDRFHAELTGSHCMHPRPVLEGLSRGGLYAYNWAAANPGKVGMVYADNPVCDFRSWPGGKGTGPGSAGDWVELQRCYGFASEAEALRWPGNPVDNLAPLVAAGMPLVHCFGDADETVPWEENTGLVAQRVAELGGSLVLQRKPGCRHHPHGPTDPAAFADWVIAHCLT